MMHCWQSADIWALTEKLRAEDIGTTAVLASIWSAQSSVVCFVWRFVMAHKCLNDFHTQKPEN